MSLPPPVCSHQHCYCPLRLDTQFSLTTTAKSVEERRRTMTHPDSYNRGDETRRRRGKKHLDVLSNHVHSKATLVSNPKAATTQYFKSNVPLVIISLLCLSTLAKQLDFIQLAAANLLPADQYPMFSSNAAGGGGPSICPMVPACQCKWSNGKQHAECAQSNLSNIPAQLPQDTQVLDLKGNNLNNQLTKGAFQEKHLTNLQKLFLAECRLATISNEAFNQLTNLIELDLSKNSLQQVHMKLFQPLKHSLRRLNLAHNPIQTIESDTFSQLEHLITLDLNNCQLFQLKPHAFRGLVSLKELKLADNRLSQLPLNVMSDLRGEQNQIITTELFGNLWNCDCELRQSIEWMQKHHIVFNPEPTCAMPARHKDIRWQTVKTEDYICPPVIVNKPREMTIGAGSNISLSCSAKGSAPIFFVWFQDEKNMTTMRPPNSTEPPSSTKLLEERRYEIAEEIGPDNVTTSYLYLFNLKLTDTSIFLCWAENNGGYSVANFSLIVDDSPPAPLPGHDTSSSSFWDRLPLDRSENQMIVVTIIFLLILVTAAALLLIFKHSSRSSKSSQSSGAKVTSSRHVSRPMLVGSMASSLKFSNSHRLATMESDDDSRKGDDDDSSDGRSSSGSCRKNPKVLAASDLDGFIEHMRSGIVNMDLHSMSPVIQFNKQQQGGAINQQQPQQPYLDTTDHHNQQMHHFPSASNTSSLPYYPVGGDSSGGAGSASMATTTSDLSPSGSGTTSTNFQHPHHPGPTSLTNCDLDHRLHHEPILTNTTTASYSSDYQANYGPDDNMMLPPMYYDHHHHHLGPVAESYQEHPMYMMGPTSSMRPTSLMIQPNQQRQQQQQQQQQQAVLHNMNLNTLQRQQRQRQMDPNFHII